MPKAKDIFNLYKEQIADDFKVVVKVDLYGARPLTAYGHWFDSHIQKFLEGACEGFEISTDYKWVKFYVNTKVQSKV